MITHYFVYPHFFYFTNEHSHYGRVSTTLEDLCRTFSRNGFYPVGLPSLLNQFHEDKYVRLERISDSSRHSILMRLINAINPFKTKVVIFCKRSYCRHHRKRLFGAVFFWKVPNSFWRKLLPTIISNSF